MSRSSARRRRTTRGTTIKFLPDAEIFEEIEYSAQTLAQRLRETAFLTRGLRIVLTDERAGGRARRSSTTRAASGTSSPTSTSRRTRCTSTSSTSRARPTRARSRWRCSGTTPTSSPSSRSPTTSTRPRAARHLSGFKAALTGTLNKYARDKGFLKEKEDNLEGEDVREGLAAVISVKLRDPQFEGQTKTKLGNPGVRGLVEQAVNQKLAEFLEENPNDARQMITKAISAVARAPGGAQGARAHAPQERARELVAAGQARRLPDPRPRGRRALPRRGQLGRRLRRRTRATASSRRSCRCAAR